MKWHDETSYLKAQGDNTTPAQEEMPAPQSKYQTEDGRLLHPLTDEQIRALNSHAALLAALASCFDMLTSPKFSGWIDANCADDELWAMTAAMIERRDQARAAIAAAERGDK